MRNLWERWKRVAKRIGDFQARFILSLLYFVIIAPFALLVRWGTDPLSLKQSTQKGWHSKAETKGSASQRATKQF